MTKTGDPVDTAIDLRDLRFAWGGRRPFSLAVERFELRRGEAVFLQGESGGGKTTLLSLICGINRPAAGHVRVDGTDLGALRGGARDRFRAERIGVIFQMFNLLPYASPLDNILLPLHFAPERRARCGAPREAALHLTDTLGLPRELIEHGTAADLSVGQQQRVAVARALIGQPPLIVADEPTSALDAGAQAAFVDLLFDQVRAAGASLLMVSHDDRLSGHFDRAVRLEEIATVTRSEAA
ncbi:ABC transporter ATP-binding protein [Tropicimonas sediminicola]|uniref:Putative ABC transport system ATP-binding protein n=1 Tax=Tropicimonas sediminicola TaxID=1031541 RepID=A0A239IJX8_9RHOB|nr:ABC transporter ATP-binding protein [Tropicimonas sediminicola]SNS93343.1 putative ABC transport system ATP-binding protein [Tropicimonas sediminicola]